MFYWHGFVYCTNTKEIFVFLPRLFEITNGAEALIAHGVLG